MTVDNPLYRVLVWRLKFYRTQPFLNRGRCHINCNPTVTVRDRDTMEQERVKIEDLDAYFAKKFEW